MLLLSRFLGAVFLLGLISRVCSMSTADAINLSFSECAWETSTVPQPFEKIPVRLRKSLAFQCGASAIAIMCNPWSLQDVDIGQVYKALQPTPYRLRSMVCYYGAHYHAFVHTSDQWIMFDDASTNVVGSWESVKHKCQLGRIQPSVLFFETAAQEP
jgi:hypothetical protein